MSARTRGPKTEVELDAYMRRNGVFSTLSHAIAKDLKKVMPGGSNSILHGLNYSGRRGGGARSGTSVGSFAPLQVGSVARGPTVNFGRAQLPKSEGGATGLRVAGSQAWLDVGQNGTNSSCFSMPGTTADSYGKKFDPNDSSQMTDPLHALSDLFLRYRLVSLVLRYCPVIATSSSINFAVAWVNDGSLTTTTFDTYAEVEQIQDSLVFPAYQPWSLKVPVVSDKILYTDDDSSDARFSSAGYLVGHCASIGAATRCGVIYIDYVMELYDMMNLTGTSLCVDCGSSRTVKEKQARRDVRRKESCRSKRLSEVELTTLRKQFDQKGEVKSLLGLPRLENKTLPSEPGTAPPATAGGGDRQQPLGGPAVLVRSEPVTPSPSPSAEKAPSAVPRSMTRSSLW